MNNKDQLINTLIQRHNQNALITMKHDPYKVAIYPGNSCRTVVSYEIIDDPIAMLNAEQFQIEAYRNNQFLQSPEFMSSGLLFTP